ncbi:MAG: hypothetical protein COA50_12335 [Flavobacteriaceae bacterium]|nr:MAG: hypothetical protein COA50_12335 [Flavobacteriaceae bacterium]
MYQHQLMPGPEIFGILAAILFIVGYLSYIIYYAFGLYHLNPFNKIKKITRDEEYYLRTHFPIYASLPERFKEKFEKRLAWFRCRKKFVFYGGVEKEHEITLLLSATASLLTLGLSNYRMLRSVLRVVIYPSQYYSRIKKQHHLGEYNPGLKTLVFSAESLKEGFNVPDDNLNLAMHEFAHALSFESFRKNTWEARKFRYGFRKIGKMLKDEDFIKKLDTSNYFRAYGKTNIHEFFSVLVESYVESPSEFKKEFPKLYRIVRNMLNFDFYEPSWELRIKT